MSRSAGRISWFLVWAVVFCDIGASVYYVPGILYHETGNRAGFFAILTMIVFVLFCLKQSEVARRFSAGGGVVSLGAEAFGPWWGCLGGQLIMVDLFLTIAISAVSGVYYLNSVVPLGPLLVPMVLVCLAVLGGLNIVGVRRSAQVSLFLAFAALVVDGLVVLTALLRAPPEILFQIPAEWSSFTSLSPQQVLTGYAGAWLAFSGLESMVQLAPAMRDANETPRKGVIAIIASACLTAPLLTFLATTSLDESTKQAATEHLISELALVWGGQGLKIAVVMTAAALLLFASNTAIIGAYHVQMALKKFEFLPESFGALSHRFQTPYRAIIFCTAFPAVVVIATKADMTVLSSIYAFGLLGSFSLSSLGVDVIRWKEGRRGAMFWLGLLTSLLLVLAFVTNLVFKPMALAFGGAFTLLGLIQAHGAHEGWIGRLVNKIPRMKPPVKVERVSDSFFTFDQIRARPKGEIPGVLVASRGATRKIFQEAVDRVKGRGLSHLYLVYVDEVPGLFFPQLANPTPEGITVLEAGCLMIRELGIEPIPVWGLSHSAAGAVAEAAEVCGCDTVVIGATQRTLLWQALRGRFIQEALLQLPAEIRLVVVG